ncbi:MAG: PSD1 domain-containing protein [Bryobacterales bacterium]|nr:PSD1 domain-containing protein [Bryobacterales bacterium]
MLSILLTFAAPLLAAPGDDFFETRIRPVLAEKCYSCHNAKLKSPFGGLTLDTAPAFLKGGDSGPAFRPGDPASSLLLEALRYTNLRLKMPPTGKLPDSVIADFETWIRMGAPDPRSAAPPASPKPSIDLAQGRRWWAFQPVRKPVLPNVRQRHWVRSPIDAFLLARLEAQQLTPAKPASKRDFLRRVTFDLTGLPPTPQDTSAYLNDNTPQADERLIDRLLASPHYGERWARHWLDLVRFAETNGHEFDNDKLDAWRYRDYVIRAFNEDVPYRQFILEHLAGDLLPRPRLSRDGALLESPLGGGYLWFGEVLNSATDSVKTRADTVDNQIDVTAKAFLGLTVSCARCHDHKFDPIPSSDYYALAGILHSSYVREDVVDSPSHSGIIQAHLLKLDDINNTIRSLRPLPAPRPSALRLRPGDVLFEDFERGAFTGWYASGAAFAPGPRRQAAPNQPIHNYAGEAMASSFGPGSDRLTGALTSKKFNMPKLWVHVRMAGSKGLKSGKEREPVRLTVVADDHKSEHFVPTGKGGWEWVTVRMTKEINRSCYFEIVDRSQNGHIAVDAIVFSDLKDPPPTDEPPPGPATLEAAIAHPQLASLQAQRAAVEAAIPESAFGMISMDENPRNVRIHLRGSHRNLGQEVPRHFLKVIAGDTPTPYTAGSGRLALAEAIADPSNPLTARVFVNRVWKHHFGQGIVRTTDNFGKTGEPPTHPELLDYLAAAFVENRWSVKQLHRMLLLSSAYRMSSEASEAAARTDPRNDLLQHMPVRRLEGEAIRDAILAVSGKLDRTLFGPGIAPHISRYQDGRGKPKSGPLDGAGRRSIYIQVRRNFLTPMFLAFDYPLPVSTIGTRGSSTVPSQALLMLNNEFIAESARAWARHLLASQPEAARRVDTLFETAFLRPPEDWEREESLAFIARRQSALAARPDAAENAWAGLCHVIFNSPEFIYVR